MSILFIIVISISSIILSKLILKKWINHLSIYTSIMGGLIFFYELKLLPYNNLVPITWLFIISSFLSFFLGIVTIFCAKKLYPPKEQVFSKGSDLFLPIFSDNGKALKYSVLFFSFVGLFVAFQRWAVLIGKFGSIGSVLINAGLVYRLNVQGEIKEFIPILPSFVYIAVFLSGVYTAYKGKFSFLTFLPFIGIVLKELTYFGRGEMLFSLMEFLSSFILFRHLLNDDLSQKFKFSKKNAIIASTILILFFASSANFVRMSRGSYESYTGTSRGLMKMKDNFFFSPSVYLYLSCDIGVFNKYIQQDNERTKFGENTFKSVYFFLAKLGIVETPAFFQRGYFIPMWANTGTFLRELHADFGPTGVILGPYLLGLIITWLWYKFFEEKRLIILAILVYFYVVIGFTFLMMVTRLNQWFMSLFFIILYMPLLERIATRQKKLI